MKNIIIAIDGYAGTGKGTVSKQLAQKLHYRYVDSGAMYRAITLYCLANKINIQDEAGLNAVLQKIKLNFEFDNVKNSSQIFLNGNSVEDAIRSTEVNANVSLVAALVVVRKFIVQQQQQMGVNKRIVMDGRDIGTNVFPNAELKIFMSAPLEIRAQRRFEEAKAKGMIDTYESIKNNLARRDFIDVNRVANPLIQAKDAFFIDNSMLTIQQQFDICYQLAQQKIEL